MIRYYIMEFKIGKNKDTIILISPNDYDEISKHNWHLDPEGYDCL